MKPALILMSVYILLTALMQATFFLVSQALAQVLPDGGLLIFLTLFLCAFFLAWPLAVRLTEPAEGESALHKELEALRRSGVLSKFSVEQRGDGPLIQVTPGQSGPADLRRVVAEALQRSVPETRIVVSI